ncbi:MAG: DUF1853 family protein, partial [Myxococcota bacterium]
MYDTYKYETQAARDLVWVLSSPSLMDHPTAVGHQWGESELAKNQGLVSRLDGDDDTLRKAIKARETDRLGEYFEILMRTWLDEVPPASVIAAGLQVYESARTVGEFDLVFRRDRHVFHWELAVKFYLGHPGPDGESFWYGPNPRDRLDKKWRKMLDRQLALSEHPAGRRALQNLGVGERVEPAAFVRGYLFEPLEPEFEVERHPDANDYAPVGWWVHHRKLSEYRDALEADGPLEWMTLSKLRWLSPACLTDRDRHSSFERLVELLPNNRTFLIA